MSFSNPKFRGSCAYAHELLSVSTPSSSSTAKALLTATNSATLPLRYVSPQSAVPSSRLTHACLLACACYAGLLTFGEKHSRNPTLLPRPSGVPLPRPAVRQKRASPYQPPPRSTRLEPTVAPIGSVAASEG